MITPIQHRYRFLPFFIIGIGFIFFAPIYWTHVELPEGKHLDRAYENADLYERIYPTLAYAFERLAAGEIPCWNPEILCGSAFFAPPDHGLLQPLNLIFLLMPPERAMAMHAFISLSLMGLFFVILARAFEIRYVPALAGGFVYAFGGTTAAVMSRPAIAAALVWTPLVFWALYEFARAQRLSLFFTALLALLFLAFCGSLAATLAVLSFALAFAIYLCLPVGLWEAERYWWKRSGGFLLLFLCLAGLSAVQWLPSWYWLQSLEHPLAALLHLDFVGDLPAGWRAFFRQFLAGEAGSLPKPGYIGVVALPVIFLAPFHRRARRVSAFFTAAALLLPGLAFYGSAFFEAPINLAAFLLPAALALSLLTAFGLDRLFTPSRDFLSPTLWLPIAFAVLLTLLLLFAGGPVARGRVLLLLLLLPPFGFLRGKTASLISCTLFAVLLLLDLYSAGANYYQHPYADMRIERTSAMMQEVEKTSAPTRILRCAHPLSQTLLANSGMYTPIKEAGGAYWPTTRRQALWWQHLLGLEEAPPPYANLLPGAAFKEFHLIDLMAVDLLLVTRDSPFQPAQSAAARSHLQRARQGEDLVQYSNESALPRASLWLQWRVASDQHDAMDHVLAHEDGARIAIVEHSAQGALPTGEGSDLLAAAEVEIGACAIVRDLPEEIAIEVETPSAALLVLADAYAPGWRATLDGAPAPVFPVNLLFRGVEVPPGKHLLVFCYTPPGLHNGIRLCLLTSAALLIFGSLAAWWRTRQQD